MATLNTWRNTDNYGQINVATEALNTGKNFISFKEAEYKFWRLLWAKNEMKGFKIHLLLS